MEHSQSLWTLFLKRLSSQAQHVACTSSERDNEAGGLLRWVESTWLELGERVFRAASELLELDIQTHDRVATWSENRLEWIVADLAIQGIGAVHVPFHASATLSQVSQLSAHADCRLLLASSRLPVFQADSFGSQRLSDEILGASRVAREIKARVVWIDGLGTAQRWARTQDSTSLVEPSALSQKQLLTTLSDWSTRQPAASQLSTLLYTSGTTGRPKGVELSQANLMANVADKLSVLELNRNDVRYALLPFSHIFARTCDLATWLAAGCHLVLASSKEAWFDELQRFAPTYLNAVPLFYARCYERARSSGALDRPGVLREMLGGRIRLCNCGGAPLSDQVYDWFVSQQVTLVTGYGLTETSPVLTSSAPGAMRRGAVGKALPQVELKLADDGEVLARGPNVMRGYYRDPQATAETFCDGWFLTGDLGVIDDEGYLTLVGRKKELIVTPGGLKIVPSEIESCLMSLPWVAQAWVSADERGRLQAVLVPDFETLGQVAPGLLSNIRKSPIASETIQVWAVDLEAPSSLGMVAEESQRLSAEVRAATADLPRYCQLVRFAIEPRSFGVDDGTATPKGSLRRTQIEQRSAHILDAWR